MKINAIIERVFKLLEYNKNNFIFEKVLSEGNDQWCFRSLKSKYVFLFELDQNLDDYIIMTPIVYKNQLNNHPGYKGYSEEIAYLLSILVPDINLKLEIKEKYKISETSELFMEKLKESLYDVKTDTFYCGSIEMRNRHCMYVKFVFTGKSEKLYQGQIFDYSIEMSSGEIDTISKIKVNRHDFDVPTFYKVIVFPELMELNNASIVKICSAISADLQTIE